MFLCIPCTCQNEKDYKGKAKLGQRNSFYESNLQKINKGKQRKTINNVHELDDDEDELDSEEIDNIIESEKKQLIQSAKEQKIEYEKIDQQKQSEQKKKVAELQQILDSDSDDSIEQEKVDTIVTNDTIKLNKEEDKGHSKASDLLKTMYLIKKLELNKAINKLEPSIDIGESSSKLDSSSNNVSCSKVNNKSELKESTVSKLEQFKLSIRKVDKGEIEESPNSLKAYKLLRVIGKSRFGKVYLGQLKYDKDQYFAIKAISKSKLEQVQGLKEEVQMEQKLLDDLEDSVFFPKQIALLSNKSKLLSVTEFLAGGELFFQLRKKGKFTEDEVRLISAELIAALEQLHSKGVVLRSLSPENILFDAYGHAKIYDLSLSRFINQLGKGIQQQNTFSAKAEYLAPEILLNKPYGLCSDWWSLGIVLYEMLSGKPPFFTQNRQQILIDLLTKELPIPYHFSKEAAAFLKGLLKVDERKRLGFKGPAEIKANRFFRDVNWKKVEKAQALMVFAPINDPSKNNILANTDQSIIANEKLTDSSYGSEDDTYKEYLPQIGIYDIKPTFVIEDM